MLIFLSNSQGTAESEVHCSYKDEDITKPILIQPSNFLRIFKYQLNQCELKDLWQLLKILEKCINL